MKLYRITTRANKEPKEDYITSFESEKDAMRYMNNLAIELVCDGYAIVDRDESFLIVEKYSYGAKETKRYELE